MRWLLDTNVAIHLRDGDIETIDRMDALDGPVALSVVTRVELEGGLYQASADTAKRRESLDLLLTAIEVLEFGDDDAVAYRTIIAACGFSRRKILDRMIAAQALNAGAALITRNGEDFRDIPGLTLVEW